MPKLSKRPNQILIFFVVFFTIHASALTHELEQKIQEKNFEDLSLRVIEKQKKVTSSEGENFLTQSFAEIKGPSLSTIKNFVWVNFIRGCHFSSRQNPQTKQIEKFMLRSRKFFNRDVPYKHPHWVVDSVDLDPAYNSSQDSSHENRHDLYRWNQAPDSFDQKTERLLIQETPSDARLYVRDIPGTAFLYKASGEAMNISLEFQYCLFRNDALPLTLTGPESLQPEEALLCFPWKSSWIYNFESHQFESPKELDPFCLEEK